MSEMSGKATSRGADDVDADSTDRRENDADDGRMPNLPNWKWRTFPVFAAFVAGLLVDSILNPPASDAGLALRIAALLGVGYVLAHVLVMNVVVARRIRARERSNDATAEDEWVDEVIHPDEQN